MAAPEANCSPVIEGTVIGPGIPDSTRTILPINSRGQVLMASIGVPTTNLSAIGDFLQSELPNGRDIIGFVPCDTDGIPFKVDTPEGTRVMKVYVNMDLAATPSGMDGSRFLNVSRKTTNGKRDFLVDLRIDTVVLTPSYEFSADSPLRRENLRV